MAPLARRHVAWIVACFALAAAGVAAAAPDVTGSFAIGAGGGSDHKPQSKLWFHDGSWWAVMGDGQNQRIWKFESGQFTKQTYADALVDGRATARADVLWDGTYLYVLMWHEVLPRFSQYSYDASTQTWSRLPGFPVDLPIPDTEVLVFDQDSLGRLWASYELIHEIRVIWTTTPDHLIWNTTGLVLESGVSGDDITTTVAFGEHSVGVLWSDQSPDATWQYGFRAHRDSDPPEVWGPLEVVDTGSAVDDHINVKADDDGRLYLASKGLYNTIELYVRGLSGGWTRAAADVNGGNATRPIVQIDNAQDAIHIFYTDWLETPNPIKVATAPRSTLVFGPPEVWLQPGSLSLNDVTGTKQRLSARSGIMALASGSSSAHWGFRNLDTDAPTITALDPADAGVGVGLQPLLQIRLADAGMGVRRSSIALALDGVPGTPTTAGTANEYIVTWTPPAPLERGRIYTVSVSAEDYAYPPHATAETYRFRTEMEPGPLAKKINFQPASGTVPAGYDMDAGAAYSLDRGTGWDKTMTMKRAGVHADPRLDTYVERRNSSSRATWSWDLANGVYRVTLVAGAPNASGKQRVEVEDELLLNNQTTAAGQFLTISEYAIAVQDGRLDLRIGGAGGSTKTQLCFVEFTYDGPAPPPPPPAGTDPAPRPVAGLVVVRSGIDLQLRWNAVTEDTTGAVIAVARYNVYRGTTPTFSPDRVRRANRVGVVGGTSFSDVGAATAGTDLYYLVTAERPSGTESQLGSNLGLQRRIALAPPAPGGVESAWIALPYATAYGNAQGLATAMNGGAGAGPVASIARLDRTTQAVQTWSWTGSQWTGTNFTLLPGEAVLVTVAAPLACNLAGSEATSPAYGFPFRTDVGNVSWICLPSNVAYADARSLAQALNAGPGPGPVTKVAWLDPASGRMQSWVWFAGDWRGTNFALPAGHGVAVLCAAELSSWSPRLVVH